MMMRVFLCRVRRIFFRRLKIAVASQKDTRIMHFRFVLLAALAAVMSPLAAGFAPSLPASAGRASLPGRLALRMRRDDIFSASKNIKMMPEPAPKPNEPGPQRPNMPMPMVSVGEGQMDIYSRLAKDRILLLGTDVNDEVANNLVAQMLFLANEDPGKDITMYINSPGGSVSAGMAIYDTMQASKVLRLIPSTLGP